MLKASTIQIMMEKMMSINLDENFVKVVGSKMKAIRLVNKIAAQYNDRADSCTIRKSGRYLMSVFGEQKNFRWTYLGSTKELSVFYTDNRPKPEYKEPKNTYYVIWVEGLSAQNGEKVKHITNDGVEYTLKMTNALRVKEKDLPMIKMMLGERHIANWVIDNPSTYFKTHYAPAGTLFRS
jgi:hypothetical protein